MTKTEKKLAPDENTDSGKTSGKAIILDMPSCGGCRTCEMACSYHHKEEFNPEVASFQILEKKDGPGYLIWLATENADGRFACDVCEDLDMPLCVEYCVEYDDLFKVLREFDKKRKKRDD